MKSKYIKPCFTPVSLSAGGTGGGACSLKVANATFEHCAVDITGLGTVFGGPYGVDCDFDADGEFSICYFTSAPNTTVFGS